MNRIVFIDRDGVICKEKHLLSKKEDLELLPQTEEAIKKLNEHNYRVVVVTNQPVVARGLCTEEEVIEINKHLEQLLLEKGAKLDRIYYCPHHPKGVIAKYTIECECRKPKPGMLLQAKKDFGLETLSESYMIGDQIGDILAGERAGCKTILVETGYGGKGGFNDATPHYITKDLYEAVTQIILKK